MDRAENNLIDLFTTDDHIILNRGQSSVWCCKKSGDLLLGSGKYVCNVASSNSTVLKLLCYFFYIRVCYDSCRLCRSPWQSVGNYWKDTIFHW